MRQLVLLRGAMGVGKSTWIKDNNLEHYTLSADNLRDMFSSVKVKTDGSYLINGDNEKKVWEVLMTLLEYRMENGEFTIIDATHAKQSALSNYKKLCEKYKYRCYLIDFERDLDIILEQNKNREPRKFVPEEVVRTAYTRMQTEYVPKWITRLTPKNALNELKWRTADLNSYKKIIVIGDIHNCFNPLKELIERLNGDTFEINPNYYYVFCGDYFDRGLQPVEVFNFLSSIASLPNVLLLEGNHEKNLIKYARNEEEILNMTFYNKTLKPILDSGVTRNQVNDFVRRLQQIALFEFNDTTYVVTHGGVGCVLDWNLIPTHQLVNGVGDYSDNIDKIFNDHDYSNIIQIHGHRNAFKIASQEYPTSITLESEVEYGKYLSAAIISSEGLKVVKIKNNLFVPPKENVKVSTDITVEDFVKYAREHSFIKERELPGDISSFNFTKKAFHKKKWDDITVKARGLFINTEYNTVIARGYEKFFNINERIETENRNLAHTMKFPVSAYHKYNGFLGLISYDPYYDRLRFFTKSLSSDIGSDHYAHWFKDTFYQIFNKEQIEIMETVSKKHNVTLTFECILHEKDPHVISYKSDKMILLDCIKNQLAFEKIPYHEMENIFKHTGITIKEKDKVFNNWFEYFTWYNDYINDFDNVEEGKVIEDNDGFMLKIKSPYYVYWKYLRNMMGNFTHENWHRVDTRYLYNEELNQFAHYCKNYRTKEELTHKNLGMLREDFYNSKIRFLKQKKM